MIWTDVSGHIPTDGNTLNMVMKRKQMGQEALDC